MLVREKIRRSSAQGRVQLAYADEGCLDRSLWTPVTSVMHNQILYEWATIVQNLLRGSPDGKNYSINAMYLEFDNSGSPVNPVPTIERDEAGSYYAALNAPRDYLRVPMIATNEETTDETLFPGNNVAVFYAQSEGITGFKNSLPFSDANNSRIYGGALVNIREQGDSSQDLILSRFYVESSQQVPKVVGKQIAVTWKVRLL